MSRKVLVLGAGMVSGPCVDYFLRHNYKTTVVSSIPEDLEGISNSCPSAKVVLLDVVKESSSLQDLVTQNEIVVSLLPAHLHNVVVQPCIECKKSLVHASYEDDVIKASHERALSAGITILSEVGLDPGIDHLLAMSCIDSIVQQGGQVTGYISLCGGLPAPECSYGPLRYKFSWYPKGMFISAMKPAKYIQDGKVVEVPAGHIFDKPVDVSGLVDDCILEDIPNRDSTGYKEVYNIPHASTVYRGTLRFKGFSKGMKALLFLGLTKDDAIPQLSPDSSSLTWRELVCILLQQPPKTPVKEIQNLMQSQLGLDEDQMNTVTSLGLLSDEEVPKVQTPLNALCAHLTRKLAFQNKERDMIVMRNIIEAKMPDGQRQRHTFDLVEMGQVEGYSAMARTVGLTAAMSACLVVEGVVRRKGAVLPMTSDIYQPVLKQLAMEGLCIKSTVTNLED